MAQKRFVLLMGGLFMCLYVIAQRPIEIKLNYNPDGSCQFTYVKDIQGSVYLEVVFSNIDAVGPLVGGNSYLPVVSNALRAQEMTKKEKKKFGLAL